MKRMEKCKVGEEDVLEAARLIHGLERMDQVKYAVLERDGSIFMIPMETTKEAEKGKARRGGLEPV